MSRIRYRCVRCERNLDLEFVQSIEVQRPGVLEVAYDCDCHVATVVAHYQFSPPALKGLFGPTSPQLPWYSPFERELDGDEIDQEVAQWGWELGEVSDVDEFLHWLDLYPSP